MDYNQLMVGDTLNGTIIDFDARRGVNLVAIDERLNIACRIPKKFYIRRGDRVAVRIKEIVFGPTKNDLPRIRGKILALSLHAEDSADS